MIISIDIEGVYKSLKEKRINKKESVSRFNKRSNSISINLFGKHISNIEKRIKRSNIRLYVKYNVWTHLFICTLSFLIGFSWMRSYMDVYISFVFGIGAFVLPFLFLQIFSDIMAYKIKRVAVDFLIIIKNFFVAGKNDIFEAFRRCSRYVMQPLKNYIEIMLYEYDHKVNPIVALENFKEKIEFNELRLYIENLQACYIYGGDIVELTDVFIEEISSLNDDEETENTNDKMMNLGLYVIVAINYLAIYILINSSYKTVILGSIWGKIVFSLDILISIYIVYMTIDKLE